MFPYMQKSLYEYIIYCVYFFPYTFLSLSEIFTIFEENPVEVKFLLFYKNDH